MRHIVFQQSDRYPIAVLVKATAFKESEIQANYVRSLQALSVRSADIVAFTLKFNEQGKAPAALIKDYLAELLPALDSIGTTHLYVTDGGYFKTLTGAARAEPHFGYVMPCKVAGYEHMKVVLGLNYQQLIYNPDLQAKLDMSLQTLASSVKGTYRPIGEGIIHSAHYPQSLQEVANALESLHQYPALTCDIEGFSLAFWQAGIGTISFAWSRHEGVAFACDWAPLSSGNALHMLEGFFGQRVPNPEVRKLIRSFLETYKGELTFHNAPYDVKVLIFTLWMEERWDNLKGQLDGLHTLTRCMHDTKVIAYLATNSTAGNVLGLKALAHEFAGNWAVEVSDIRRVPLNQLLQYNLVDALCTHFVREKYEPVMVADSQADLYRDLMMPSQKLIIQLELTGMPMSKRRIQEVKQQLLEIQEAQVKVIRGHPLMEAVEDFMTERAWQKDFEDRKAKAKHPENIKRKPFEDFPYITFNPNSGPQMQLLFYEFMGLPVIDLTETKQPATGADTIEKLINHAKDQSQKDLLAAFIIYGKVTKILSAFIPAFEEAINKDPSQPDVVWLHGSFNLGGTVSGRLSSSDPNLQNIPANTRVKIGGVEIDLGKLVKTCFVGPAGWLFTGADFNSLEDYISALTTKDPNKLAVYEKGFDGHALRAVSYFREEDPELAKIDINDPAQVNLLKKNNHPLRQESKAPTFLLTYGGTYHGMMANLGWSEEKSKKIEAAYHELYKVSDEYVRARLEQASKDGFVAVAFGLKVRTPLLKQVVFGSRTMPYEAAAEGRTAGNALGQSYGLLNNRAAMAFFKRVWNSPYRYKILPVALIHDAIYILIADDLEVVTWANKALIEEMRWQELPEIQHPTVKLGAALDVFWPSWAKATTLPNDADPQTILKVCRETKDKLLNKP
jgi:DNA polymerase I